jgi:hypothetical protein
MPPAFTKSIAIFLLLNFNNNLIKIKVSNEQKVFGFEVIYILTNWDELEILGMGDRE